MYGYPQPQQPPKSGLPTVLVVVFVLIGLFVFGALVLGVLAVIGTRSYIDASKAAEATATVGQLQKQAAMAYEMERPSDGPAKDSDGPVKVDHALCPSASKPVPASLSAVAAKKYMSSPNEWLTDRERNAGFACLRFEMTMPQYFQYDYKATASSFTATAHGDLDGDGEPSTFEAGGTVDPASDTVRLVPLTSRDPKE